MMTVRDLSCARSIRIAEAKRRFGLTERAIRFYEERGMIEVERGLYNQRYFDEKAQTRLAWISSLRSANIALRDIEEIIALEEKEGRGYALAAERLADMRANLSAQLRTLEKVAADLDRTLGHNAAA
jgi:DNA-binding transcriptional MerR regulator